MGCGCSQYRHVNIMKISTHPSLKITLCYSFRERCIGISSACLAQKEIFFISSVCLSPTVLTRKYHLSCITGSQVSLFPNLQCVCMVDTGGTMTRYKQRKENHLFKFPTL